MPQHLDAGRTGNREKSGNVAMCLKEWSRCWRRGEKRRVLWKGRMRSDLEWNVRIERKYRKLGKGRKIN